MIEEEAELLLAEIAVEDRRAFYRLLREVVWATAIAMPGNTIVNAFKLRRDLRRKGLLK
jgi:hypothetical protein